MGNITQKWVNLLIPFTSNYGTRLSETELSTLAKVPQQTASRHLAELTENNLISYTKQGRNKLFYFDHSKQSTKTIYAIIESHKALVFQQKLNELSVMISELLKHSETIIIFGSYSSYSYSSSSDLDLLIAGKYNKKEIKKIKERQAIPINEHYTSYEELEQAFRLKKPLAVEILKNHTLFGNVSKVVGIFLEVTS